MIFAMLGWLQMGYAQDKSQEVDIISHQVQLGETVRMLSQKYLVNPAEIYKLNKFAIDGIRQGMVLQIPVPRKEPAIVEETPTEEVQQEVPQETVQEAVAETPKPQKAKKAPPTVISREGETEHVVESGETLYSLSRKYGISVDEIKSNNNGLKKGLQVGQVVKIPSTRTLNEEESSLGGSPPPKRAANDTPVQPSEVVSTGEGEVVSHQVAPKETLYSLSKKYGVTVDDIKNQNPDVAQKGLQVGQTITIRKN